MRGNPSHPLWKARDASLLGVKPTVRNLERLAKLMESQPQKKRKKKT